MTDQELRHIFGRFQSLNLAFLVEDLRRDFVAFGSWAIHSSTREGIDVKLCPIGHGIDKYIEGEPICPNSQFVRAGLSSARDMALACEFMMWWDNGMMRLPSGESRRLRLLAILESLWRERQEDADVVQAVCEPQEEMVMA